ncbi:MAG: hypothetical protein OXH82_02300, partial [Candidatus Dadabacteria bacterium]|nr:hypothetical protein [Candidatus Dadabacteria bacterium]MDE0662746.1 hypothetical protein [Candidatus Dadabacteria bacterium]
YGMVLGLFFALGLVFSFGIEASATHDGDDDTRITADEVTPTSKQDVKAFLKHIIDYYNQVVAENAHDRDALTKEAVIFGRRIRQEGDYKNPEKNMYSMGIRKNGIVSNHAGYPNLFGYEFNPDAQDSAVASTIQTLIEGSGVDTTKCVEDYDGQGRVACAERIRSDAGDVTVIAGLHHAEDDSAFRLPDCEELMLPTNANAETVFNDLSDANLKAYVKGVIEVVQQQVADATNAQFQEFVRNGGDPNDLGLRDPTSPVAMEFSRGLLQRVYAKSACFREGDFKHGNIYVFIMNADPVVPTVLFNGNNFDLNGTNLGLVDNQLSGEKNIARLFNQELGDPVNGASTYVNYHWDDPTNPDDNVPNFFETNSVPGTSCKRSYIEVADINAKITPNPGIEILYIFGSGTYPGDGVCAGDGEMPIEEEDDDDDGCAIAGAGHMSQSTLLNLFLIASVLFSVAFLRRRV